MRVMVSAPSGVVSSVTVMRTVLSAWSAGVKVTSKGRAELEEMSAAAPVLRRVLRLTRKVWVAVGVASTPMVML